MQPCLHEHPLVRNLMVPLTFSCSQITTVCKSKFLFVIVVGVSDNMADFLEKAREDEVKTTTPAISEKFEYS